MFKSFKVLFEAGILAPKGLILLIRSFLKYGKNLLGVVKYASDFDSKKLAISDGNIVLTYGELLNKASINRNVLLSLNVCGSKKKVALISKNTIELVHTLIALSSVGVDVFMVNHEYSISQIKQVLEKNEINTVIAESKFKEDLDHVNFVSINSLNKTVSNQIHDSFKPGKIVVLTGGSTGVPKVASRKTSVKSVLSPFLTLLKEMKLHKNQSVIISVPICHGFGLAALMTSIVLRKSIYIQQKFNAHSLKTLITEKKIEVGIFVPTMLKRFVEVGDLKGVGLHKILTGGATLSNDLYEKLPDDLRDKVYNLYGTSEAGFCIIGTPEIMNRFPNALGKAVSGAKIKVIDSSGKKVQNNIIGELAINSSWTISSTDKYVRTGDLAYVTDEGLVYLKGRNDELIITGGENVYPVDVESVLIMHEDVLNCKILGMENNEYGHEIIAFIQTDNNMLSEQNLLNWLKPQIARYQMPKSIFFCKEIPVNSSGKITAEVINEMKQKIKRPESY